MVKAGSKQNKLSRLLAFGLVLGNFFVWLAAAQTARGNYLEADFFDVGQGDAAFIRAPNGVQILIDGGPGSDVLEKLGAAMPFYDRDIDWVVLSHPDRDHLAGLLAVLKNYRVRNILWSGISKDTPESAEWLDSIAKEKANIVIGSAGDMFNLGGNPDLLLQVLAPPVARVPLAGSNEASVVVRLVYGGRSLIFTGDAGDAEEQGIADAVPDLQADIVKIAHHGSKNSANEVLFESLLPAAAVISVGARNPYGHPSAEVLEMLSKYDIKTLRTDQNGDIVFRTDGEQIFFKTQK